MREVIGQSNIQPILTGARQTIETGVQALMQKTLDDYGAGIQVQQVQLQKVDPPTQVIDSFRDVQAARSDLERLQNEAQTYANRVVPEARGRAAKITQDADGYRQQTIADARGQTARFLQVYEQYKKAPDVTRERMYLETMEHIFGGTDKTIIDTGQGPGVVPYLPLGELSPSRQAAPPKGGSDEAQPCRRRARRPAARRRHRRLQHAVHRVPDQAGPGGAARPARARHHRTRPQRESAVHRTA